MFLQHVPRSLPRFSAVRTWKIWKTCVAMSPSTRADGVYPLVIEHNYGKSPFIVNFPMKNGDFP